jgi:hypothetical protein
LDTGTGNSVGSNTATSIGVVMSAELAKAKACAPLQVKRVPG